MLCEPKKAISYHFIISNTQKHSDEKLKTLKREILAIPDSVSLTGLLERFLKDRQHVAIVVNEHGGTDGLVTLEDLIETLMGMEIMDETDNVEDMRVLARKQWVERAKAIGMEADFSVQKKPEQTFQLTARRSEHLLITKFRSLNQA